MCWDCRGRFRMGRTVFASDLRLPSLWCMLICFARGDLRGKGTSGQAAALRWSGLRFAPTSLRCSVLWPAAELTSLTSFATFKQPAASQSLIRAARGGHKPCAARRSKGALQPARTRLRVWPRLFPGRTTTGSARQAVPGGGDFCGDEKRSPEVGARSAHPHLTRRGCLSGVSAANVASSAARPQDEHRSGVGAKRRPPQHEPPPGTACRASLGFRARAKLPSAPRCPLRPMHPAPRTN